MIDLKPFSSIFNAKFGVAVTIMVFTSACAHEVLIAPANSATAAIEDVETPEPMAPAQVSPLSTEKTNANTPQKTSKKRSAALAKRAHKTHKGAQVARHSVKKKSMKARPAAAAVAQVQDQAPAQTGLPQQAAGPEIAPPSLPAPIATAGVQTEIDGESSNHLGLFALYAFAALAVGGLIYLAPRARRAKPKRKLVYNG